MNERLEIRAGAMTSELWDHIQEGLTDDDLAAIEPDFETTTNGILAGEPVTIAVSISLTSTAIVAMVHAIEKWLENRRQQHGYEVLLRAFSISPEVGAAMLEIQKLNVPGVRAEVLVPIEDPPKST